MALCRRFPCGVFDGGSQELRALWKNRIRKSLRFPHGLQPWNGRRSFREKTMQRDIETETRSLYVILFYLHLYPPARNHKTSVADRAPEVVQVAYHNDDPSEFT